MMISAGGKMRSATQLGREVAYLWGGASGHYATAFQSGIVISAVWCSSKRLTANCLQRYPSLDRFAYLPSGPVTFFRRYRPKTVVDIGYHCLSPIELGAADINSDVSEKLELGRRLCRKNQSFWPQWLFLALLVVLKATSNVALRVQLVASWPQKCWVPIQLGQPWLVQPSAYFATTQASTAAARLTHRADVARSHQFNRRRGHAPAAVLRLGTRL